MSKLFSTKQLLSLLFCGAVLVYGCKPEDAKPTVKPKYTMQFNLTASGVALPMDQTVTNSGNTRYYLDVLRFYMGYPRLVKTDGTEVPLANVLIVKLDNLLPDNPVCNHSFGFEVPAGDYKAIRFGLGMPTKIRDSVSHYHHGVDDPLNADFGLLWAMTKNVFRNIAINMNVDTSMAQNQAPKRFVSLHILEDDTVLNLYKELEFPAAFSVGNGKSHTSTFTLDANRIFFNSSNMIDLRSAGTTDMVHADVTGIALGVKINDNFAKAITNE